MSLHWHLVLSPSCDTSCYCYWYILKFSNQDRMVGEIVILKKTLNSFKGGISNGYFWRNSQFLNCDSFYSAKCWVTSELGWPFRVKTILNAANGLGCWWLAANSIIFLPAGRRCWRTVNVLHRYARRIFSCCSGIYLLAVTLKHNPFSRNTNSPPTSLDTGILSCWKARQICF